MNLIKRNLGEMGEKEEIFATEDTETAENFKQG
jgi:hypothetical protein